MSVFKRRAGKRNFAIASVAGLAISLAALTAACGGGGGYGSSAPSATAGSGAVSQSSPAPAMGGSEASPTAAAQPTAAASPASGTASGSTQLTVVAMNISFDKTTLQAPAGEVKITLDNQDGIAHNLHLFKGTDASGESVGMTPIEAGPVQNSFTATLPPGTYFYHCDVHPDQMHGTLVVQ